MTYVWGFWDVLPVMGLKINRDVYALTTTAHQEKLSTMYIRHLAMESKKETKCLLKKSHLNSNARRQALECGRATAKDQVHRHTTARDAYINKIFRQLATYTWKREGYELRQLASA